MRVRFVALAIVVILLVPAMAAQGPRLPWNADFPPADRSPYHAPDTGQNTWPGQMSPSGGFSSVDFLGQIRKQLDFGNLISMFPFTWPGRASASPAADRVEFLGNSYESKSAVPLPGKYYYTGEEYGGRRIYVSASDKNTGGVPALVYLKDGDSYMPFAISGRPAVNAYVLCGAFNANETVRFGVSNDGPAIELPNAAPYEVRRKENGDWRTIYSAIAAQVITKLPDGSRLAWQWDQRLDDGSLAPPGDYQVVIAGKYMAPFRIAGDVPVVESYDASLDQAGIDALAVSSPALDAFRKAYPDPSADTKEDVVGIMQYKAWALGLDPEQLRKAIVAAGDGLPCMAVHASHEGQPAWIILFSPRSGTSGPAVYVVEDGTGRVAYGPSSAR